MVEWSNTRPVNRLAPVRILAGGSAITGSADRLLDPGSNPSNHKLLTPPPHPKPTPTPTHPPKIDIQFQGDRGLKIKKSIGGLFFGQNNDFTRGWTSNIMPWGMLCE